MSCHKTSLPALKVDMQGKHRVDFGAILALAFPLFLNSGVQALLNLTDGWFLGRISTAATAAMGVLYFLIVVLFTLFGGVGMYVQTLVAQAYGQGKRSQTSQAAWTGCWSALLLMPLFVWLAFSGHWLLLPFQLAPNIERLALEYWLPRILGGAIAVANLSLTAFFNGIGRTNVTLTVAVVITAVNIGLNELLIFRVGWGMAGAAWATTISLLVGAILLLIIFLSRSINQAFHSRRWRPKTQAIRHLFMLGLPLGLLMTSDLTGLALFQIMQVKLGVVEGAATQIVMMLISTAYMPTLGIAQAGTTLVGQSIGAGDTRWAKQLGNLIIGLCVMYTGIVGLLLALNGKRLIPLFTPPTDPHASAVIALGQILLWLAIGYNLFNALSIGSAFCLQGTGDVKLPSLLAILFSWFGFVPLTHILSFQPGEGLVHFLPQQGWGVFGGWIAALISTMTISSLLFWRWRSLTWQK